MPKVKIDKSLSLKQMQQIRKCMLDRINQDGWVLEFEYGSGLIKKEHPLVPYLQKYDAEIAKLTGKEKEEVIEEEDFLTKFNK